MLMHLSRTQGLAAWLLTVAVAIVAALIGGVVTVSAGNVTLWLVAAFVPCVVILRLWPDAPAQTVGDVLHAANTPGALRP